MKKIYGLVGKNIDYSLSPVVHNAAFDHFDIPAEYKLFDIDKEELEKVFCNQILKEGLSGFNVTVPYKTKIRDILNSRTDYELHEWDKWVRLTGSVNTVKIEAETIHLCNTDLVGFNQALLETTGYNLDSQKDILVLGAGGAGQAISIYLSYFKKHGHIHVYDIDQEKLSSLKEKVNTPGTAAAEGVFSPVESIDDLSRVIEGCDLIINATPLGTKEGDDLPIPREVQEYLKGDMVVYDLVYARETELVRLAKDKGLKAAGGLGMLVNQAAAAFNIWTDKPIEKVRDVMKKALPDDLKKVYRWNT